MKPKIFIGSSVEGLSVAYAIQQNLNHVAESTVWSQGVFELSQTSIESLINSVERTDFGIFVFSPDDVTLMRGQEKSTIRDNVIFEFGLFLGRLGRERVFFVLPEGEDIHLPTDLLGITPGKYDPSRSDGSLEAATGPICNQIRQVIQKLPVISTQLTGSESEEDDIETEGEELNWIDDFVDGELSSARTKVKKKIKSNVQGDNEVYEAWLLMIDFKENEVDGMDVLLEFADKHKDSVKLIGLIITFLKWENYIDLAIELLDKVLLEGSNTTEFLIMKAQCLYEAGEFEKAIEILSADEILDIPEVAVALGEIYKEEGHINSALKVMHNSYVQYPSNVQILYKYGRALLDEGDFKEALYLFNSLIQDHPKESAYFGYLGNACVHLDIYDKAMTFDKKASTLTDEKESWILNNIGNMFKNKGFYSLAEEWLRKGLEIDPGSEYGLERLSSALKAKNQENKKFVEFCKEGRLLLRNKYKK